MHWKSKRLLSVLAVLLTLFLPSYLFLCFSGGRPLTPSEYFRFSDTIWRNALLHADESGFARSLSFVKEAISSPVKIASFEMGGQEFHVPLPRYSVPQGDQHYVTFASSEELWHYFNLELPLAGWRHVSQAGAGHLFEGSGVKMGISHRFYLGTGISEIEVSVEAK